MVEGVVRRYMIPIAATVGVAFSLVLIFFYAPVERVMGLSQKIFYFHLSSAVAALLGFFTSFVASVFYLLKRDLKWDDIASASVEVGVVFTTIVLVTGSVWGRSIWNVWWTWDPRLTTSLILWFIYVSYLILREIVQSEDKRAIFCAVVAIVGFFDVPVVFFSARLLRSIHPTVIRSDSVGLEPPMILTLIVSILSFAFLFAFLLGVRAKLANLERKTRRLERKLMEDYQ